MHNKAELQKLCLDSMNLIFGNELTNTVAAVHQTFSEMLDDTNRQAAEPMRHYVVAMVMYRLGEMDAQKRLEGVKANE